jgi:HNH endonuclease
LIHDSSAVNVCGSTLTQLRAVDQTLATLKPARSVCYYREMANLDALFRLYAANLEQCKPEHRGSFMCPVCLDVIDPQPDLKLVVAEEHVVPEALGGRITTLTCRPCNNDSGSDLESHLVQHVLVEARKRPHEGTIDIDGAVHRAELHFPESPADKPQLRIIPIRKQSDPRQLNAAEQRMTEGAKEIKLDMSAGYVPLRSLVALIRSAYL